MQERVKVAVLQRTHLGLHPAVLVEEVDSSEHCPVAGDLADFSDVPVERRLVHIVEDFLTEERRHRLHFHGHGRVLVRQVGMIRTGIDGAEGIAAVGEIVVHLFHNGVFRVGKINVHQSAHAGSHLIHQAGGLAVVDVFGVLADLGNFNGGNRAARKQAVQDTADQHLKGRGAGQAGAGQDGRPDLGFKAAQLVPPPGKRRRYAADQRRRGVLLGLSGIQIVQVDLHRLVALGIHADDVRAGQGDLRRGLHVNCCRQHTAVLMVGVVAADLRAAGGGKMIGVSHFEPPSKIVSRQPCPIRYTCKRPRTPEPGQTPDRSHTE